MERLEGGGGRGRSVCEREHTLGVCEREWNLVIQLRAEEDCKSVREGETEREREREREGEYESEWVSERE